MHICARGAGNAGCRLVLQGSWRELPCCAVGGKHVGLRGANPASGVKQQTGAEHREWKTWYQQLGSKQDTNSFECVLHSVLFGTRALRNIQECARNVILKPYLSPQTGFLVFPIISSYISAGSTSAFCTLLFVGLLVFISSPLPSFLCRIFPLLSVQAHVVILLFLFGLSVWRAAKIKHGQPPVMHCHQSCLPQPGLGLVFPRLYSVQSLGPRPPPIATAIENAYSQLVWPSLQCCNQNSGEEFKHGLSTVKVSLETHRGSLKSVFLMSYVCTCLFQL